MYKILNNLKISFRATLSVTLFIATLIYSSYGAYISVGTNVDFAEKEKLGNYYQRPLMKILYHANLLQSELAANSSNTQGLITGIDTGMDELKDVQDMAGEDLQFTEEGLASRDRSHLGYNEVSTKWTNFKNDVANKNAGENLKSFIADIRGMISHAGDTSNLVLDPDLDSYYLMDVTLLALPQTINRVGDIASYVLPLLQNPLLIGTPEKIKFHSFEEMNKEADIARIKGNFDTSYKEDKNFYGVSLSYEKNTKSLLEAYIKTGNEFDEILDQLSQGKIVSVEEFKAAANNAITAANNLEEASLNELDALLQVRADHFKNDQLTKLGYAGLGVLISVIFYIIVVRSIVSPLSDLTRIMTKVAGSDLSEEVPYKDSRSEIGSIAQALEVFKNNRLETIKLEKAQKEAEERSAQEKRSMLDNLANGFEKGVQGMITSIASASSQLSQTAEAMSKVADDTNKQSVEVASASEQASHNVQSVASAAEEMAATVQEISKQISLSNNVVNDAREKAEIADNSSKELVEMSKSVGAIATLIEDIAGQINLLALNATIESARSGEAGKGFAVVANEVKNLATQTAKATEQIRQQLEAVQNTAAGVAGSLGQVREAIAKVSEGSAAIAAAVEEQSAATQEIVSNMNTATQGVEQINGGIFAIKGGTNSTTDATRQVLEAARTLSGQATQMDKEVKTFLQNLLAA
jgi:methyl-accepting chemotaxis protein